MNISKINFEISEMADANWEFLEMIHSIWITLLKKLHAQSSTLLHDFHSVGIFWVNHATSFFQCFFFSFELPLICNSSCKFDFFVFYFFRGNNFGPLRWKIQFGNLKEEGKKKWLFLRNFVVPFKMGKILKDASSKFEP